MDPSFYMGTPGIDTLGAILYKKAPKDEDTDKNIKKCI